MSKTASIYLLVSLLAVISGALILQGCSDDKKDRTPADDGEPKLAGVAILSVDGTSGDITIVHTATCPSVCLSTIRYSLDGGTTYNNCTPAAGSGTRNPQPNGAMTEHQFTLVWDSAVDAPGSNSVALWLHVDCDLCEAIDVYYPAFTVTNGAPASVLGDPSIDPAGNLDFPAAPKAGR